MKYARAFMHLLVGAVLVASLAITPASAAKPPTLGKNKTMSSGPASGNGGESSASIDPCDPSATPAVNGSYGGFSGGFDTTGQTSGVYPGTFYESGNFTVGTEQANEYGFKVTRFHSNFVIYSGQFTISGTRTMTTRADNPSYGSCAQNGQVQVTAATDYHAVITGPDGTAYTDSGIFTGLDYASGLNQLTIVETPQTPSSSYYQSFLSSERDSTKVQQFKVRAVGQGKLFGDGKRFTLDVLKTRKNEISGSCSYTDKPGGVTMQCLNIQNVYDYDSGYTSFSGQADVNGETREYRISVTAGNVAAGESPGYTLYIDNGDYLFISSGLQKGRIRVEVTSN